MQENTLKALIAENLGKISFLKGIELTPKHYDCWVQQILTDYAQGKIVNPQKGFDNLLEKKSYSGLDYSVFLEGAMNKQENCEEEWQMVLRSAKNRGIYPISARAGKALLSLGGLTWLREGRPSDIDRQKKQFLEAYNNTPEPGNSDFHCPGLLVPMILSNENQKLLEV